MSLNEHQFWQILMDPSEVVAWFGLICLGFQLVVAVFWISQPRRQKAKKTFTGSMRRGTIRVK